MKIFDNSLKKMHVHCTKAFWVTKKDFREPKVRGVFNTTVLPAFFDFERI